MKVEEKHLTGQIKYFPLHVVQEMVDEQVRQGNPADPSVFATNVFALVSDGGFYWDDAVFGNGIWEAVIRDKEFHLIPKPENHTQVETTPEPAKPKRKIIQISESMTSDERYVSPWNLSALCDDGTVWVRSDNTCDWVRLPDIPQDGD